MGDRLFCVNGNGETISIYDPHNGFPGVLRIVLLQLVLKLSEQFSFIIQIGVFLIETGENKVVSLELLFLIVLLQSFLDSVKNQQLSHGGFLKFFGVFLLSVQELLLQRTDDGNFHFHLRFCLLFQLLLLLQRVCVDSLKALVEELLHHIDFRLGFVEAKTCKK